MTYSLQLNVARKAQFIFRNTFMSLAENGTAVIVYANQIDIVRYLNPK